MSETEVKRISLCEKKDINVCYANLTQCVWIHDTKRRQYCKARPGFAVYYRVRTGR